MKCKKIILLILEFAGFEIVEKRQTIYTLENTLQEIKDGLGEGVFAIIKARKIFARQKGSYKSGRNG